MAKPNNIASAVMHGKGNASSLSPLAQSYNQTGYLSHHPAQYLPRPDSTFTQGSFTPGGPIEPLGINAPRDDSGRPDPRRTQFPINWNLPIGEPGSEGLKLASFATLRALADQYSIARSCINKRIHEIVALEWDIIPTDEAELEMRNKKNKRNEWDKRRKEVLEFFTHPDSDRAKFPTFAAWLTALLEDMAVIDAVAIHMRPPRKKNGGKLGSDLASLDLIDATTIRPLLDVYGSTPRPPDVAYQQYLWGVPRVDMTTIVHEEDIKLMDGPVKEYRSDQLIYLRHNPRNWTPYGLSWVEQAIMPISIGLARQQWQWNYYQEGSIPGQWVVAGNDIATPTQIRQFQDALNSLAGDPAQKHKIIVLPPGSDSKDMKPMTLADQFDEWVVSTVTMAFDLTPMEIGVTPKVSMVQNASSTKMQQGGEADQGAQRRLESVTEWLKACLFDYIIQDVFGQEDMQWSWGLTDRGESRDDIIAQHVTLLEHGYESIDEGRIDLGRAPWGLPETSVPLAWTTAGPVPLTTLTSETGEAINPAPGQADNLGAKPTDDELITPAHGDKPHEQGPPKNPPQAQVGDPSKGPAKMPPAEQKPEKLPGRNPASQAAYNAARPTKAARAEFSQLARYLKNGKDPKEFLAKALTQEVIGVASVAMEDGPDAAIDAARKVMEGEVDPESGLLKGYEPGDYRARHLIRWYNMGAAGHIVWGVPGDFDRCVLIAGRHVRDPKGFCAERHHDATGAWPGHAATEQHK